MGSGRALLLWMGPLALVVALSMGARHVTLLVLDVPERRATLLVKRNPSLDMRLLESERSLCGRQGPGSPLHSLSLPRGFCPLALATGPMTNGSNVLVELPFLRPLHRWAAGSSRRRAGVSGDRGGLKRETSRAPTHGQPLERRSRAKPPCARRDRHRCQPPWRRP